MNIGRFFSPVRIWFLFKRDFRSKWKDTLISICAALGVFLLIMIIVAKAGRLDYGIHYAYVSILLYVFGMIFASMAFKDAHRKLLNHDWLMLPASTFEKFFEKAVLYSVIIPIATIIIYWVFNFVALLVIRLFFGEYYPIFNIADPSIWQMYGYFVIGVSVFILGAAWFKNNNFIKTIVAIVVFSIIMSLLSTLIIWLVFNDYFWPLVRGNFDFYYDFNTGFKFDGIEAYGKGAYYLIKFIFYGLLTPVCWLGAWLKLREVEVKDGV
ncbi:MAG: hypothetical protein PQJ61_00845 [Spirochaetales bacterium]|uniref:Uncharacterized protein n=1 Tax=Candidatus Thalassospirochaeta sargassi TaxID=3119039 RepID=A0AAJ1IFM6_9SPIO|nr:hypothetical protein [Spirochaetales bacterium]